jgi:hypothetical protein
MFSLHGRQIIHGNLGKNPWKLVIPPLDLVGKPGGEWMAALRLFMATGLGSLGRFGVARPARKRRWISARFIGDSLRKP